RGLAPEKRATFWSIQCGTRETDYLVETVDTIRTAEGLLWQCSEIDCRSGTEKSGMPNGRISSRRGNPRVTNYGTDIINTKAATNDTAAALAYVLHRRRTVRVVTKRCLTRGSCA